MVFDGYTYSANTGCIFHILALSLANEKVYSLAVPLHSIGIVSLTGLQR